jgi:hypothetical protein
MSAHVLWSQLGLAAPSRLHVTLDGKPAPATLAADGERCTVTFVSEIVIETGRRLELHLA